MTFSFFILKVVFLFTYLNEQKAKAHENLNATLKIHF